METLLWTSALGGSAFFALRVILMLFGGIGGDDFEAGDMDGDLELDSEAPDSHDTVETFNILTLTGLAAFFMMFGWVGLTAYEGYQLGTALSFLFAIVAGFAAMLLVAYVFKWLRLLESPGATVDPKTLVGMSAEVYARIPAGGSGRVFVTLNGMRREFDASSTDADEIKSFEKVKVTALQGKSTLVVSRESTN